MSSTSRKARKRAINYQEVESDEDIELEDQDESGEIKSMGSLGVLKKVVGDTYGTKEATKRSKKRSRKAKTATEEEDKVESTYDSKLLLRMPFDIFAETCSHLEGVDLINLAQVNKSLRRTLLSKAARSIWASRRKADGYPLPDDMTELEMATLVYARNCQNCGVNIGDLSYRRSFQLRTRLCGKCSPQILIRSKDLRKSWPDLHPQAIDCVRYKTTEGWVRHPYRTYIVSELVEVDNELKELEEEDDLIISQIESLKSRSGTRSRCKPSTSLPIADRVSDYVAARQEWVKEQEKRSQELTSSEAAHQVAQRLARSAMMQKKRERWDGICLLLQTTGWKEEEIKRFWNGRFGLAPDSDRDGIIPRDSPQIDPQGWAAYHLVVSQELAISEERQANSDRWSQVFGYAKQLIDEVQAQPGTELVPTEYAFMSLPSVKLLWEPSGADSSREALAESKPRIMKEISDFAAAARVLAIRHVLAANREVKLSTLSEDPSNYPTATYDSTFFALATSHFSHGSWRTTFLVSPFPEILQNKDRRGLDTLKRGTTVGQVRAIRSMLKAASLNPSTSTWDDLVQLGRSFVWANDPVQRRRTQVYNCKDLLRLVLKRGPSLRKIKAGQSVEIGFKRQRTYGYESSSEEEEEEEDERSDDEEEDAEESEEDA